MIIITLTGVVLLGCLAFVSLVLMTALEVVASIIIAVSFKSALRPPSVSFLEAFDLQVIGPFYNIGLVIS